MDESEKPIEISQSIDWYHEGEVRAIEIGDVRIEVKFVGRKGRRGRIAIVAPPGTTFCSVDSPAERE